MSPNLRYYRLVRPFDRRSSVGTSLMELPFGIAVFVFFMVLPLLDLAVIAGRTAYVHSAAQNAVRSAIAATSFKANGANGELSAVNIAKRDAINTRKNGLGGVHFEDADIDVLIIGTPVDLASPPVRTAAPLTKVDQKAYIYQLEVTVRGQVDPLINVNTNFFGDVPGLTGPMPIQATYKQFCEHPAGLSK